ncbi:sodium:solute symporter family protein [Rhodovulum sulfidophilum]|uniref:Cation acetate symporter n=1 Tax=Rhodovulum sulfidophilum TaxID=35806 RepID=A0ABS1RTK1_RHOSU|nr:sodium:solute symporter family protein [Rhodovulum sulfidophilum]ANB33572.1 cation acetate symporter [Rhodovulum sulfidophilum DSM 1374]ANB37393.1 cation acetate symporter [Rhodovulum sulfidophilum]MBL3559963.1 cation acetate symporter [Rhodovulum sulfidophilum]MBL3609396.1 cation acetate symporter [Rhodovulum sulfidophilum]MCE8432058.1 cation acetate symporter [Rhodovulum sulfidophilum]
MDQFTLNLIFVGLTFAIYIGIAIWARAGSTAEFYAAGRGVHPVLNGMATGADWMSAASFISMAGIIALAPAGGYTQSAFLMGWTGGYVLLALLLAPYLRKFGKFTVPEFIGDRFYSGGARLLAVICLIVISITYVIGQMRGVGVTFGRFLEVSTDTGLYIGAAIVFAYAVFGGMKGITYTQVAQYVVLIIAYTIPAIFISLALTDSFLPQLGLIGSYAPGGGDQAFLAKLDEVVTELGFTAYTADTPNMLNMFLFTMSLMIGTAGLPHVIIRFFTVPKVADARTSAGWALVFIALLYTVAPAVGSMARLNLTTTMWPNAVAGNALDGDAVSLEAIQTDPRLNWVKTWEQTGLLHMEDLNGDGRIQYYNDKNPEMQALAAERGWQGNEVTKIDNDIMVLANPEIAALPSWVIALVAAGAVAAALSTAAGLLLAISSAISHDLIKGAINPKISEKGELLAARISMTGAILIATWLGLNPPGFAAQVVALAFGLAAATIFPVLMMGIFSKRVNKEGAIAGMLVGLVFTAIYIFLYKGWFFIPGTATFADVPENYLFGISPLSIGAVGAILNFAVAFGVSSVTRTPPREVVELVESIRVPRGAGAATGH